MLSLSGLGLSFVSLWFFSGQIPQGGGHTAPTRTVVFPQLAQTWPGSSSTVPMPHAFPMCFRMLALGLASAENFGSVLGVLLCLLGNTA